MLVTGDEVKFVNISSSDYQGLQVIDDGTLYFLNDTGEIYVGSEKYGGSDGGTNYSTDEQVGGVWLYHMNWYYKTIMFDAAAGGSFTTDVDVNISSYMPSGIQDLIGYEINEVISISGGTMRKSTWEDVTQVYKTGGVYHYSVAPGLSDTSTYWYVKMTIKYVKGYDSNDAIIPEGIYGPDTHGTITGSQADYVMSNWRSPSQAFNNSTTNKQINISGDPVSTYMYNMFSQSQTLVDGCNWVQYYNDWSYIPYAVTIYARTDNPWVYSYPNMYVEFSEDGQDWDTLWQGIPRVEGGSCINIQVTTSNEYQYFRLRYDNGTGYGGNDWCGCLPCIQIYGKSVDH